MNSQSDTEFNFLLSVKVNFLNLNEHNSVILRLLKIYFSGIFLFRPFDPQYYEDEFEDEEMLDEEGRTRLKLKVCGLSCGHMLVLVAL